MYSVHPLEQVGSCNHGGWFCVHGMHEVLCSNRAFWFCLQWVLHVAVSICGCDVTFVSEARASVLGVYGIMCRVKSCSGRFTSLISVCSQYKEGMMSTQPCWSLKFPGAWLIVYHFFQAFSLFMPIYVLSCNTSCVGLQISDCSLSRISWQDTPGYTSWFSSETCWYCSIANGTAVAWMMICIRLVPPGVCSVTYNY